MQLYLVYLKVKLHTRCNKLREQSWEGDARHFDCKYLQCLMHVILK